MNGSNHDLWYLTIKRPETGTQAQYNPVLTRLLLSSRGNSKNRGITGTGSRSCRFIHRWRDGAVGLIGGDWRCRATRALVGGALFRRALAGRLWDTAVLTNRTGPLDVVRPEALLDALGDRQPILQNGKMRNILPFLLLFLNYTIIGYSSDALLNLRSFFYFFELC